jgi:beta-xylosidase
VIGVDREGHGQGEPVLVHKKPNVGAGRDWPVTTPADSDEFNQNQLGPQWQWQANPKPNWILPAGGLGFVRLFNVPVPDGSRNLWDVPNLLLQKFPGPEFTVTAKVTFNPRADGEKAGLVVMGLDYATVSIERTAGGLVVSQTICKNADQHGGEKATTGVSVKSNTIYLRVRVPKDAVATFSASTDGSRFMPVGEPFATRPGKWIGAKVGIFATGGGATGESGYADFDWFRFE